MITKRTGGWLARAAHPAEALRSSSGRFQNPIHIPPARPTGWGPRLPAQRSGSGPGELDESAERDERLARVEAVLFLAREPLHARRLARFAHLADGTEANTIVAQLNRRYDWEQRAFFIAEVGGGYQLRTRKQFAPWLRRLQHIPPEIRLTQPALETLAVIAYRQPIVRAEVDAIRGVNCGEVVRQLMERDLVRVAGRGTEIGRPYYYGTTRKFLQVFGFRDLSDLPRADLLRLPVVTFPMSESGKEQQRGEGDIAVTCKTGESVMDELEMNAIGSVIWQESTTAQRVLHAENESEEEWEDDDDEDDDDDEEWEEEEEEWEDEDEELDEDEGEDDWEEEEEEEWEEVEDSDEEWEEGEDDDDDEEEEEWEDEDED